MTKAKVILAISFLSVALATVVFYGCGSSSTTATTTKFTIVGAGE